MKRDWDVIRAILIQLEEKDDVNSSLGDDEVNGYDQPLVAFHMYLLNEAGLIKAGCTRVAGGFTCKALHLTWEGCELLERIRHDSVWNKIKSTAREKSLGLSIDVIVKLAKQVIESML